MSDIKTVGVVGAGTMGSGIAQTCAAWGMKVYLYDIKPEFVDGAIGRIDKSLSRRVEKGKMSAEDKSGVLSRINKVGALSDMKDADLVIEAVLEIMDLKKEVFSELGKVCDPKTILATNTSSMSITEIAATSGRPEKFCGIHFFNPVPVMGLVEVIHGINSDQATIDTAKAFAVSLGKTPVEVKKDSPGFIVNRLLLPYMNEAAKMYAEGVASIEDIDTAVKLGLNYPMGPFAMIDMGGLELTVAVLDYFAQEFNDLTYAPAPIFRTMIRAGKVGKGQDGFLPAK